MSEVAILCVVIGTLFGVTMWPLYLGYAVSMSAEAAQRPRSRNKDHSQ